MTIQQLIQNTIFQYARGFFPTDPIRLMAVIARNLSSTFVDVAIQRYAASGNDTPPVSLADATVPPNSEVALSAPDANQLVASASAPSRVRFLLHCFILVILFFQLIQYKQQIIFRKKALHFKCLLYMQFFFNYPDR
ncbi:hypothetical protein ACFQZ1_08675 [Bacillus sp. CGMCC 1.60114]